MDDDELFVVDTRGGDADNVEGEINDDVGQRSSVITPEEARLANQLFGELRQYKKDSERRTTDVICLLRCLQVMQRAF
jgi:hypothetical protein